MTDIERRTRQYVATLYGAGPTVEVAVINDLESILAFARSKEWISEDPEDGGHSISEKGIREVLRYA